MFSFALFAAVTDSRGKGIYMLERNLWCDIMQRKVANSNRKIGKSYRKVTKKKKLRKNHRRAMKATRRRKG
jgi:hypothetical protein